MIANDIPISNCIKTSEPNYGSYNFVAVKIMDGEPTGREAMPF